MISRKIVKIWGLVAFILSFVLASNSALGDDTSWELNDAQNLIYLTPHFLGLPAGSKIDYHFESVNQGKREEDVVALTITQTHNDNKVDLKLDFLTGENQIKFPDFAGYLGNPTIITFLERDARKMSELTGGGTLFFRNRIRHGLADDPIVHAIKIMLEGKEVDALQFEIRPYQNAPLRERMTDFIDKVYRITFSEHVPGYLVRIETNVDGEDFSMKESLKYSGVHAPPAAGE